jgi:alkanesulfonate monooxygenase SsuD/methylene tetrahydromethanopterin reductase-like flavin-dependent oxidoreductase (luciferase family)
MAAAVSSESFVAAGEKGHSILLAPFFQSRTALKENLQLYKENLLRSGHSPDGLEIVAGYHSFVDETPALAARKWESHYMRYMNFVGSLIAPEEYTSPQYESWRQLEKITWERMYPTQVLCGDPAQCVERIGLMQEQFGVTHFWVYMDLGGLEHRQLLQSIERFATQVIPHFR